MALKQITFDAIADGTAITSGNAASIGASTVQLNGNGAAFTVKSAAAAQGARGFEIKTGAIGASWTTFDLTASAASASFTAEIQLPQTLPTGTNKPSIVWLTSSTGSTMLRLVVDSTGLVQLQRVSGVLIDLLTGQAGGTRYQMRLWVTEAVGSTDQIHLELRPQGGGTALATYDSTTSDIGDNPVAKINFGVSGTVTESYTMWIDSVQLEDARTTFIPGISVAPNLSLTSNQNVTAGATVTATANATDDGSITGYAWSVVTAKSTSTPTLTGSTTATVTFTAPAAGNVVTLQCVVTDNSSLTATATTEVRVPLAATATARPLALAGTGVGTWTNVGGAANTGAALADESDTTYDESPVLTSTETSLRQRAQPYNARSSDIRKHRLWTDTGAATVTVRLYEGSTLRQSWTQAINATPTEYPFVLSSGTISAISDWSNLHDEVAGVA